MKKPLTDRARALRREMTDAEQKLWLLLRQRHVGGAKFRRQVAIGTYIADFACHAPKVIVEVDGRRHTQERDDARTRWLEGRGFSVLRFSDDDALQRTEEVVATIHEAVRKKLEDRVND